MTSDTIATRFGSGQAVRRLEDDALLTGKGKYADDVLPQGQLVGPVPALALSARAHRLDRHVGSRGDARRGRGLHRRRPGGRGREAAAGRCRLSAAGRLARRDAGAPSPRARGGALRRRADRGRRGADPRAGARRHRSDHDRFRGIAVGHRRREGRRPPGAPLLLPAVGDNISAEMRHGDAAASDKAFASRGARRADLHRQPAPGRLADRATHHPRRPPAMPTAA